MKRNIEPCKKNKHILFPVSKKEIANEVNDILMDKERENAVFKTLTDMQHNKGVWENLDVSFLTIRDIVLIALLGLYNTRKYK